MRYRYSLHRKLCLAFLRVYKKLKIKISAQCPRWQTTCHAPCIRPHCPLCMPHAIAEATTALPSSTRPCRILIKVGFYTDGHHPLLPLLLAIVILISVVLLPPLRQRIWNSNWNFSIVTSPSMNNKFYEYVILRNIYVVREY